MEWVILTILVVLISVTLWIHYAIERNPSGFAPKTAQRRFLAILASIFTLLFLIYGVMVLFNWTFDYKLPVTFVTQSSLEAKADALVEKKITHEREEFQRKSAETKTEYESTLQAEKAKVAASEAEKISLTKQLAEAEIKYSKLSAAVKEVLPESDSVEVEGIELIQYCEALELRAQKAGEAIQQARVPFEARIAELEAELAEVKKAYKTAQDTISAHLASSASKPVKEKADVVEEEPKSELTRQQESFHAEKTGPAWRWQDTETGLYYTPLHSEVPPSSDPQESRRKEENRRNVIAWARQHPHLGKKSTTGEDISETISPSRKSSSRDWGEAAKRTKQGSYPQKVGIPRSRDGGYVVNTQLGVYIPQGGEKNPQTWMIPPSDDSRDAIRRLRATYEQTAQENGWPIP